MLRYYFLAVFVLTALMISARCLAETPPGFESIMPTANLAGWVGGATKHPAKISARQQAQWDSQIAVHWRIVNGELVSDGQGPNLVTKRSYGDFELWVDWKLAAGGDSGIYLRDTPQVQLWDPNNRAAHKHGSQRGSGGLWNNQGLGKWPATLADKPIGEWNRMQVRMVGPYVRVTLNDQVVVKDEVLENYYQRKSPVFSTGRLHLQTHGYETHFRRLLIRKIKSDESRRLLKMIAVAKAGGDQAAPGAE